nr:response regulator [Actinomadura madurae]
MLAESGMDAGITVAPDLATAARALTRRTQCIIVDLSTPGIDRLEALRQVLGLSDTAAVVVLTGLDDAHLGVQAVAAGAEDYLVKQEVDAPLLARAIRYAIERKRSEETERRLVEARILGRENARLERGLLPVPLIDDPSLRHHTRYRPGPAARAARRRLLRHRADRRRRGPPDDRRRRRARTRRGGPRRPAADGLADARPRRATPASSSSAPSTPSSATSGAARRSSPPSA